MNAVQPRDGGCTVEKGGLVVYDVNRRVVEHHLGCLPVLQRVQMPDSVILAVMVAAPLTKRAGSTTTVDMCHIST